MNNKFFGVMYALNIVAQAVFTLLTPTALMLLTAWLLVSRMGAPSWIYAIFIPFGFIAGIVAMIKFVITASANLERLENQKRHNNKNGK